MKSPREGRTGERASEDSLRTSSGCSVGKTNGALVGDMLSVGEIAEGIVKMSGRLTDVNQSSFTEEEHHRQTS